MDPILDAIDAALAARGLSDAAASKLAVGHPSLIKNMRLPREGEKRYNLPALQRLADVLDLEFYFGPIRRSASGFSEDQAPLLPGGGRLLHIPWHEPHKMGGSCPIGFEAEWLEKMGLKIESLTAVVPDQVDLFDWPTNGSIVAIDASAIRGDNSGLWCFKEAGKTIISRLQFDQGAILILPRVASDNVRLLLGDHTAKIHILGQVVWSGHVWR